MKINWGIIGLGKIAKKFATDIQVVDQANLYAVASRSQEKATTFKEEFGAIHAFGSYEALLNCAGLDAVYIATPHVFHYENTMMCLEASLPVLCEKPFAMNQAQVKSMIAKAKAENLFLMEALWTSCLPSTLEAKKIIEQGELGEIISIRADFGFKAPVDLDARLYNRSLGGGALLDIGIYPVFLALMILGYPQKITAVAKLGKTAVDEEIGIILEYEQGAMSHLHATILTKTKTEAFIYGTKGTLHLHERWFTPTTMTLTLFEDENQPRTIDFNSTSGGFEYEIAEASRCLIEGKKESDLMPLSQSWKLIQLLDAVRSKIGLVYPEHDK